MINVKQTVETDIVAEAEIASVVKRALSEGWTIIAITPRLLHNYEASVSIGFRFSVVKDYLIVRSR